MRFSRKVLPGLVAAFLLASPLFAFTMIESVPMQQRVRVAQGAAFRMTVNFTQAAQCDGALKLQPGQYNVEIFSLGDGTARVSFWDPSGQKSGEAHGIIVVQTPGAASSPQTNVPAVQAPGATNSQKVAPGGGGQTLTESVTLNFAKIGFSPNSRTSFSTQGSKLNLEILSSDGGHAILIGLLVPAVQKVRQ